MTRRNLSTNPAAGTNATDWGGTSTPVRVTGLSGFPRTTGVSYSTAGFPLSSSGAASPSLWYAVSVSARSTFNVTNQDLYANFSRSSGGDTQPTPVKYNLTGGTVSRIGIVVQGVALATKVCLLLDGINPSANGLTMTASMVQEFATQAEADAALAADLASTTYADGNTSGWAWDGTAENSSSTESGGATVTSDLDVRWAIQGTVTSDLDVRWAIRGTVTSDLDVRWAIGGRVQSDLDIRWAVQAAAGTQVGASYELEDIMDALAGTFDGVATGDSIRGVAQIVSCVAEVPTQVAVPAIVLEIDDLDWDLNMGAGADSFTVLATVLVQFQDVATAQRELWRFLSRKDSGGVGRIKAALAANQQLGGLVSYAHLARVRNIGTITYNAVDYLGAELIIEVMS